MQVPLLLSLLLTAAIAPASGSTRVMVQDFEKAPSLPNAGDTYMITPHCWNQGEEGKAIAKKAYEGMHNPIRMHKAGIPSTWFETLHVYGCKITASDTIYYCDNIEVGRHATLPISRERPLFFMVNLATGGGWPVDLSRYDGLADMYLDYVRVYKEAPWPREPAGAIAGVGVSPGSRVMTFLDHSVARGEPT